MMKIALFLALGCAIQASPIEFKFSLKTPIPEQIEPIMVILHQRLDSIINRVKNDVDLTNTQSSKYIENEKISANQNQMELVKGLIKRINEIISNSPRKDCVSAEKDLIESLQKTSFESIDNCGKVSATNIKKLNSLKLLHINTAYNLKIDVGNIMNACTKFNGFDSLLVDCLKVQAEKISDKIYYMTFDIQHLEEETSNYFPKIYEKQGICHDYIKRQSIVEGNLILEKITQCIKK